MELEGIILSEINQRKITVDFTCMWNLKNIKKQTNETKLTDIENRLIVTRGEGGWGGWAKCVKGVDDTATGAKCGDHCVVYTSIQLLHGTPKTNNM